MYVLKYGFMLKPTFVYVFVKVKHDSEIKTLNFGTLLNLLSFFLFPLCSDVPVLFLSQENDEVNDSSKETQGQM